MPLLSALPVGSGATGTEIVPATQSGTTYQFTLNQIVALAGGSIRKVTGTTDTILAADRGKLVTYTNASAIAVTVPVGTSFGSTFYTVWANLGAGTATFTPTGSTINGASNLALATGEGALVFGDGANYFAQKIGVGGGGGLTNFSDALNTTSPNSTTNAAASISATNGTATRIDIFLSPKSTTGAFALGPSQDGTTTGGNKRGSRSVDLQMGRSSATAVVSGADSFAAGTNNTASSATSYSIGDSNISSATYCITFGFGNTASGYSSGAWGRQSTADGTDAKAIGNFLHTRGIAGMLAFGASGSTIASANKRQGELHALAANTTDATPTKMATDGASAATANQIVLNNSSVITIEGTVSARQGATGDAKTWNFIASAKRGANAAATALLGTPTVTNVGADSGAAAWAFAVVADTTNGAISLQVTGEVSKTIVWTAALTASFCSA